ncbi:MAG: histidine phosphatase family protein [Pirellulales bacterium]
MLLYLVRHAFAGQHGDPAYPNDELRPLTPKGRKQFRRTVKKLARRGLAPAVIATSPLLRCRQTAAELAERLDIEDAVVELDALRPGSHLEELLEWTRQQTSDEIAWVGHSPDIDCMAAKLLGASEGAVRFAKGAVAAVEFDGQPTAGSGTLCWFVTPKSLGA